MINKIVLWLYSLFNYFNFLFGFDFWVKCWYNLGCMSYLFIFVMEILDFCFFNKCLKSEILILDFLILLLLRKGKVLIFDEFVISDDENVGY